LTRLDHRYYNFSMKKRTIYPVFFAFILFGVVSGLYLAGAENAAEPLDPGKVNEKVLCRKDSGQSYAIYLPTSYVKSSARQGGQHKWPVLFTFDPGGRAALPPNLFKSAAEKYNYIVVCPTNCKNGPWEPNMAAMRAVWEDVRLRFPVDKQRIYAAGFSGGSRMASYFSFVVNNPVRGIIGCGAGLAPFIKPENIKFAFYYGIVGFADFNYVEMTRLEKKLAEQGSLYRFIYYDAKHRWAPEAFCERAVEWMEIQAVKEQPGPRDEALIKTLFEKERRQAQERENAGDIYFAVGDYESIARDFKAIQPAGEIEEIENKITQIKNSKPYKKFQKEEEKRLKKEDDYMQRFIKTVAFLRQPDFLEIPLNKIISELRIKGLEKEAREKKNIYDAGLAERLLYNLANQCLSQGEEYLQKKDYTRVKIFLEIGEAAGKHTWFYSYILYDLAAVHALQDQTKKALKYFQEAVDNGFDRVDHIEKDKDLDGIRHTDEFKAIVEQLKTKEKDTKRHEDDVSHKETRKKEEGEKVRR